MTSHEAIDQAKERFRQSLDHLIQEYSALQTGRASTALVEGIMVSYYGSPTPLKHMATLSVQGAQEIRISPFDKGQGSEIEKAIRDDVSLGLNPVHTGSDIILHIPPLTEERRKDITKVASAKAEESKISIRQARQHAMDQLKKDEELSEDELKRFEQELQKEVEKANTDVESLRSHKTQEIMKV